MKSRVQQRILVVDDDPQVARLERQILEQAGYEVVGAKNGAEAITAITEHDPDLVLLDVRMPGLDGFKVCERIREFSHVPIIMVTSLGQDEDKVHGLEIGADDYLTKPFNPREFSMRVKAVLRRTDVQPFPVREPELRVGDLVVDFEKNRVSLANNEVILSATEYRLLAFLAQNAGRILTSEQILDHVWGEGYEVNVLRVTISRLRQKLGDSLNEARYLINRPGIGYMLAASLA